MKRAKNIVNKKILTVLLTVFAIVTVAFAIPETVHAAAKKIELKKTKCELYAGEYTQIEIKKITGLKNNKVVYKSDNTKIATVNSKGVVTAKKKGNAKITVKAASNSNVKASFKLTVKAKPKTRSLKLAKDEAVVQVGKTATIKVKAIKGTSSNAVVYKSANSAIATVSDKGIVTGKKAGTTTITVTSAVNKKLSAKFKVTVKRASAINFFKKNNITLKKVGNAYKQKGIVASYSIGSVPDKDIVYDTTIKPFYTGVETYSKNKNYDVVSIKVLIKAPVMDDGYASASYRYSVYTMDGKTGTGSRDGKFKQNVSGLQITSEGTEILWDEYEYNKKAYIYFKYKILVPKNKEVVFKSVGCKSLKEYKKLINNTPGIKKGEQLNKKDLNGTENFFKISAADARKALDK